MPKNILPLLLLLCAMVARAPAQSYLIVGDAEQKKVFTTNIRSGAVTAFDFSANNTTLTQIAVTACALSSRPRRRMASP